MAIIHDELCDIDAWQIRDKRGVDERGIRQDGRAAGGHGNERPQVGERIAVNIIRIAPIQLHGAANGYGLIRFGNGHRFRVLRIDDHGICHTIFRPIVDDELYGIDAGDIHGKIRSG